MSAGKGVYAQSVISCDDRVYRLRLQMSSPIHQARSYKTVGKARLNPPLRLDKNPCVTKPSSTGSFGSHVLHLARHYKREIGLIAVSAIAGATMGYWVAWHALQILASWGNATGLGVGSAMIPSVEWVAARKLMRDVAATSSCANLVASPQLLTVLTRSQPPFPLTPHEENILRNADASVPSPTPLLAAPPSPGPLKHPTFFVPGLGVRAMPQLTDRPHATSSRQESAPSPETLAQLMHSQQLPSFRAQVTAPSGNTRAREPLSTPLLAAPPSPAPLKHPTLFVPGLGVGAIPQLTDRPHATLSRKESAPSPETLAQLMHSQQMPSFRAQVAAPSGNTRAREPLSTPLLAAPPSPGPLKHPTLFVPGLGLNVMPSLPAPHSKNALQDTVLSLANWGKNYFIFSVITHKTVVAVTNAAKGIVHGMRIASLTASGRSRQPSALSHPLVIGSLYASAALAPSAARSLKEGIEQRLPARNDVLKALRSIKNQGIDYVRGRLPEQKRVVQVCSDALRTLANQFRDNLIEGRWAKQFLPPVKDMTKVLHAMQYGMARGVKTGLEQGYRLAFRVKKWTAQLPPIKGVVKAAGSALAMIAATPGLVFLKGFSSFSDWLADLLTEKIDWTKDVRSWSLNPETGQYEGGERWEGAPQYIPSDLVRAYRQPVHPQ